MNAIALPFLRPWWLLALLPVALVLWHVWRKPAASSNSTTTSAAWSRIVDAHLLAHLLVEPSPGMRRAGLLVAACGLVLAVLALAGPTRDRQAEHTFRQDVLRVLAVDLSPPMGAHIEPLKPKLLALLRALPEGQTALLIYAEEPYLVVPPTTDVATIERFVPELAVDAMPVKGNRPDRALRMAEQLFERNTASARELLWVTTGAASSPLPAQLSAQVPELNGVRLSALHAAASADQTIAAAAERSGGLYQRVSPDDSDVKQLVTMLRSQEKWRADAGKQGTHDTRADIGYWLLPALLPLAALAFRRGLLMLVTAVACAGLLPPPADARALPLPAALANSEGQRLLEGGEPAKAAERFADRRWRAAAHYRAGNYEQAAAQLNGLRDADSLYNRANALARQGRFADALQSYDASLALRPKDPDTLHNRDLVQRLMNQNEPPPMANKKPPPPAPKNGQGQAQQEAARIAEQWLRGVPDDPASLLRRKLQIEHLRRASGQGERAW